MMTLLPQSTLSRNLRVGATGLVTTVVRPLRLSRRDVGTTTFLVRIENRGAIDVYLSKHLADARLEVVRPDGRIASPLDPYAEAVEFTKRAPTDVVRLARGRTMTLSIPSSVLQPLERGEYGIRLVLVPPKPGLYLGISSSRLRESWFRSHLAQKCKLACIKVYG